MIALKEVACYFNFFSLQTCLVSASMSSCVALWRERESKYIKHLPHVLELGIVHRERDPKKAKVIIIYGVIVLQDSRQPMPIRPATINLTIMSC